MKKRRLGSGLEVSALGLGCMNMTGPYGPPQDEKAMVALLKAAVDRGVTFFDTAEAYGPFANEKLLCKAFEGIRNEVVLATKFGMDFDLETGTSSRRPQQPPRAYSRSHGSLAGTIENRLYQSPLSAPL